MAGWSTGQSELMESQATEILEIEVPSKPPFRILGASPTARAPIQMEQALRSWMLRASRADRSPPNKVAVFVPSKHLRWQVHHDVFVEVADRLEEARKGTILQFVRYPNIGNEQHLQPIKVIPIGTVQFLQYYDLAWRKRA